MNTDINEQITAEKFIEKNLEKIKDSRVFLSLFTTSAEESATVIIQTGIAVLLDKPIYILGERKAKIPKSLIKLAKAIEIFDEDEIGSLDSALKKITTCIAEHFKEIKYNAHQNH